MNMFSENDFEQSIIEKIKKHDDFVYKNQTEIIQIRDGDLDEVLLYSEIRKSLPKLNLGITEDNINQAIAQLKRLKESDLITANIKFQKFLQEGIKVKDYKLDKYITVKIIDGINDSWIITNQFIMNTNHHNYKTQKPDMVAFCNGIPMIVFELKGFKENQTLEDAFNQMSNYQKFLPNLFVYNAFNILANPSEKKFGSITSQLSRYQYWRGPDFSGSSDNLFTDLFVKDRLFDVIVNYTFWTSEKSPKKIIAAYHQYYGVKLALESINNEMTNKNKDGNGKAGIYWHTQGSGKSFSMLFLVKKFSKLLPNTTFLIVTDRNDLDNQLYKTFLNSSDFIGQKIQRMNSISELKDTLEGRKINGVFFSTVQKFSKDIGLLSNRDDILIITDEAHRSHTNVSTSFEFKKDENQIVEKNGNAASLRMAFPNSTFIGFTGTPIEKDDKSTSSIFGNVITTYLMNDAENDGVVVPIRYESRKPELSIDEKSLRELDSVYDKIVDEIEMKSELPGEAKKKLNKAIQQVKNIISDPDRIDGITKDFIDHYESRASVLKGKAMFVSFNRHIAYEYYKRILHYRPEWKEKVKLIITNSNNQQDDPGLIEAAGTSEYRKRMAEEFKKEDSQFQIAIVVDMWLTGFDVPSLDAIYLDKPIKMHNLMQTIARTNRVYTNKEEHLNKEYGLVIDYIGLWNQLNEALAFYSNKDTKTVSQERDLLNLKPHYIQQVNELYEEFEIKEIISSVKIDDKTNWVDALELMTNQIIKNKKQESFVSKTKNISKWLNEILSITNDEERFNFQMLIMTRGNIINIELGKINIQESQNKILEKMTEVIKYNKTTVINSFEGEAILLSDIIRMINSDPREGLENLDAEMKIVATKRIIGESRKINFKKSEELMKKLNDLLMRYDNNYISMEDLINGIKQIGLEVQKMNEKTKNNHGFTEEEMGFYALLLEPVEDLEDFDKSKIDKILRELLEEINSRQDIISTWVYNEVAKQKVRKSLKEIMLNNDYPPTMTAATAEDIVKQIMIQKDIKEN